MLDLTQVKKYYELKWFDGEILHLNMPSQEILMKIMKLEELEDIEEQLVQFKNIFKTTKKKEYLVMKRLMSYLQILFN